MKLNDILKNKLSRYFIGAIVVFIAIVIYIIIFDLDNRKFRIVNFLSENISVEVSMRDKIILFEELEAFSEKVLVERIPNSGAYDVIVKGADFSKKIEGPYDFPSFCIFNNTLYIVISSNKEVDVDLIR